MENKYYTPKIEEFHVGFEVRILNFENYVWGEYTIKADDKPSDFLEDINADSVRVKYLDSEDIESLGWMQDGNIGIYLTFNQNGWTMVFNPETRRAEVDNMLDCDLCFNLIIKNKSELKKLMEMLNIN